MALLGGISDGEGGCKCCGAKCCAYAWRCTVTCHDQGVSNLTFTYSCDPAETDCSPTSPTDWTVESGADCEFVLLSTSTGASCTTNGNCSTEPVDKPTMPAFEDVVGLIDAYCAANDIDPDCSHCEMYCHYSYTVDVDCEAKTVGTPTKTSGPDCTTLGPSETLGQTAWAYLSTASTCNYTLSCYFIGDPCSEDSDCEMDPSSSIVPPSFSTAKSIIDASTSGECSQCVNHCKYTYGVDVACGDSYVGDPYLISRECTNDESGLHGWELDGGADCLYQLTTTFLGSECSVLGDCPADPGATPPDFCTAKALIDGGTTGDCDDCASASCVGSMGTWNSTTCDCDCPPCYNLEGAVCVAYPCGTCPDPPCCAPDCP